MRKPSAKRSAAVDALRATEINDQLAVQAVHRIRRRLVADRVRLVNQIRGLLSEHGIVIARDIAQLRRGLPSSWGASMTASARWSKR